MSSAYLPLLPAVRDRLVGPIAIALGSPRTAADLVDALGRPDTVCWQMDVYQSQRLMAELSERGLTADVENSADLWDLSAEFNSVVMPSMPRGERQLKIDIVEQAFHVLKPRGIAAVLSPVAKDQFFPPLLKKVFGKVALVSGANGTSLWSQREGDHKRRRHEMHFSVKVRDREFRNFVSRPGIFSYGHLDEGTRALLDVLESRADDRIIDLGCGSGVAGIVAAARSGPNARLTLADSNIRAVAVAKINAESCGLEHCRTQLTADFHDLPPSSFDLALANPPYFAQMTIARLFAEQALRLLAPAGRLYMVTRQYEPVAEVVEELFGPPLLLARRDYAVIVATKSGN